jgi:5-(hydroxymethyl)furfural/furfural oxidase
MFPPGDLYFSVLNRSSWNYFGQRLAVLGVVVHKPYSRGRVLIQSAHSGPPLRIDFSFLSDKRDVQRFVTGVRAACRILRDERIRSLAQNIGVVRMQGLARALAFRTMPNRLVNTGVCAVLPAFPWLERRIVERVLGTSPDALSADGSDERIISLLRETVTGLFHPVGTCRMGAQGDRNAVVDNCGRVFGVANLRVADASIMPSIPRANTNIPTIMIAEKIAHAINHAIA